MCEGVKLVVRWGESSTIPVKDICLLDIEKYLGWFQAEVRKVASANDLFKHQVEISQCVASEVDVVCYVGNRALHDQVKLVCQLLLHGIHV